MAIQFQCGACHQPIEVDEEWGGKTVACPFCQSRVTAPTQTQLEDEAVPTASPTMAQPPHPSHRAEPSYAPAQPKNTIAIVAAVAAGLMLVALLGMRGVQNAHIGEIERMEARMLELSEEGMGMFQASQTASMELMEANDGAIPGWIVSMWALMAVAGMLWVATLVCGILGARWLTHRRYAVGALVVCGVAPVLFCCGGGL